MERRGDPNEGGSGSSSQADRPKAAVLTRCNSRFWDVKSQLNEVWLFHLVSQLITQFKAETCDLLHVAAVIEVMSGLQKDAVVVESCLREHC